MSEYYGGHTHMKTLKQILVLLTGIIATTAFAQQGVVAPVTLPSARVLPEGVRNFNMMGVYVEADEKFNRHGDQRVLADPFYSNVSFKNMIDGQYSSQDRATLEAKMLEIGASPEDSFGTTAGQVNAVASVSVPVFAIGLSKKTTAAIAIPINRTSINVSTGILQTNAQLMNQFRDSISVSQGGLEEFDRKFADPVNSKLADFIYDPLENITDTRLGDIKLVLKHQLFETDRNRFAVSAITNLPTGEQANPNKIVDIQAGDGQTDIGVAIAHDLRITPALEFSTNIEYINQLPDTDEKRVPYTMLSKLSPDKDNLIDRDLGDIIHVQAALQYAKNGFNAGVGYSFQYKGADVYEGTKFEAERYTWIGRETQQRMQAYQASLGYDTITLFKQKKFPAPMRASLTYIAPFEGKNVTSNPTAAFNLSLFF